MRIRRSVIIVLLIALVGLTGCDRPDDHLPLPAATIDAIPAAAPAELLKCSIQFRAGINQGPDADVSWTGTLKTEIDPTGVFTGMLALDSGPVLTATGQFKGRAANLILDLGGNQFLFAVGALQNDSADCAGTVGGALAGPRGDSGSWGDKFIKR